MRVIVLGGGLIGVLTGYFLAREGHEVVVLERNDALAAETSFQNGGLLAPGHSQSWASPGALRTLVKSWFEREPALRLRLDAGSSFWGWVLPFLRQCNESSYRANTLRVMRCMMAGLDDLRALRAETGIDDGGNDAGVLYVFRTEQSLAEKAGSWTLLRDNGLALEEASRERCVEIEPALGPCREEIVGGFYAPNEGSGDACRFTRELAALARRRNGLRIELGTNIESIRGSAAGVEAVVTDRGEFAGDAYVLATGPESPDLVRPLGLRLPICPAKGYTVSVSTVGYEGAPHVGVIEEDNLVAFARLGDWLRVGGQAEFSGFDASWRPVNFSGVFRVARELFPEGGDYYRPHYWACLRPVTPGGPPILGASPIRNLFLNVGHGAAGWTMGSATSRAVADIVCGRKPDLDMEGLAYGDQ